LCVTLCCNGLACVQEKEKEQLLMNIEKPDRFDDCLEESGRARKSRVGKAMSARVYRAFTTVGDEKDESEKHLLKTHARTDSCWKVLADRLKGPGSKTGGDACYVGMKASVACI